ncbi:MAG: AI-2E family transporter [Pseudomonas sp.]|uniref:AI-2E family transporter n=1 Tax=Pseudomonas sp. TaxID=306 RepID=UPI00339A9349
MHSLNLENKTFLLLLVAVTCAFIWILLPYYGALFWAVILAILFAPLQRHLARRFGLSKNLTALGTLFICLVIAILPVVFTTGLLIQEASGLYKRIETGELDVAGYLAQFRDLLPSYLQRQMDRLGLGNINGLRDKIVAGAMQGSQVVAAQAYTLGQNTFEFVISFFVMLYLLFFFLRDGPELVRKIRMAIPLGEPQKRRLQLKFTRVVRATVKGNVLVAVAQGALGGLIFWFLDVPSPLLWAVLMAFLSLLPAVGAGIVWVPVAAFFLLSGAIWQGVVLTLFGVLVIGLVDNVLRPILVGRDTRMPDYLILVSTLGGLTIFGLNGFVIGPLIAALFLSSWGIFTGTKKTIQLP